MGKGNGDLMVKVAPCMPGYPGYEESLPTALAVYILEATDLRNADLFGGKSDPYVICKLKGKDKFQTDVVWNDPNPKWNHGPEEIELRQEKELRFEVWDKDFARKGDLLGHAAVSRQICLKGFEGQLGLGQGNGTLKVRIVPVVAKGIELAPGTTMASDAMDVGAAEEAMEAGAAEETPAHADSPPTKGVHFFDAVKLGVHLIQEVGEHIAGNHTAAQAADSSGHVGPPPEEAGAAEGTPAHAHSPLREALHFSDAVTLVSKAVHCMQEVGEHMHVSPPREADTMEGGATGDHLSHAVGEHLSNGVGRSSETADAGETVPGNAKEQFTGKRSSDLMSVLLRHLPKCGQ